MEGVESPLVKRAHVIWVPGEDLVDDPEGHRAAAAELRVVAGDAVELQGHQRPAQELLAVDALIPSVEIWGLHD